MTENSASKLVLLHSIENNRMTVNPKTKSTGISTEQLQANRDAGTNTPNYAEQMAKALENGSTAGDIVQMLMQNEPSEAYWKLMTERRQRAIQETVTENQQLHTLIDDISKENDQLRVLSGHCDYLQNVLNSFTNEHDSLLDDSRTN